MNQESHRTSPSPLMVKPESQDRKPSSAAAVSKKIVIKSADMFGDMQKEAIDIAIAAFEKHSVEKDVAEHIKKEFDKNHGPTWHCIVGRNFDGDWRGMFSRDSDIISLALLSGSTI